MTIYRYCMVQPDGVDNTYYYIAEEEVKLGDTVIVPFGPDNRYVSATVLDVQYYEPEEVPFPLDKMKTVYKVLQPGEMFIQQFEDWPDGPPDYVAPEVFREIDAAQEADDYDAMLAWACAHHDDVDNYDVMDRVVDVYAELVDLGNPVAALNLGALYYSGTFLPQDYEEAARLYKVAADGGEVQALCNLGYCYYYGRHQAPDYKKAYEYFSLGALLGRNANCLYKLGDLYLSGKYVEKNEHYAMDLYFAAMDACMEGEDDRSMPDIDLRLGRAFLHSEVVHQDPERAHFHLSRALTLFYHRRKHDPFVKGLIRDTKQLLEECETLLDREVIS